MKLIVAFLVTMNRFTVIVCAYLILYFIGLTVAHHILKKKGCSLRPWRLLCLLPIIVCGIHFAISSFKGDIAYSLQLYLPLYLGSIAMALYQFLANKKMLYRIASVLTGAITIGGIFVGLLILNGAEERVIIGNYSRADYVESFEGVMSEMQKHYVLNEWKDIDYDALREQFMPKIEEAQANHDPVAYYTAMYEYVSMFHDGHVWLTPLSEEGAQIMMEVEKELAGNDYGFSLFTIENSETIAILVEENSKAEQLGIHNGTVITKWNGVAIDEAILHAEYSLGVDASVEANQDMLKPIFFAGMGDAFVEVSFIDDSGTERTEKIENIGNYQKRMNYALECFTHRYHWDNEAVLQMPKEERIKAVADLKSSNENFASKMITEDCGYLVVNIEEYDTMKDIRAEIMGEYPEIKELVNAKLDELETQGMEKLIIDTRNNGGGYPTILYEITSLFTEEEIELGSENYVVNGEYKQSVRRSVKPDGKWADLPVVVLTNYESGSCGDGLVYALSKCPNVTTMGITCSGGYFQIVGGCCILPNTDFDIGYPIMPSLDENGEIMIDTTPDRETRIPLDVMIPVNKDAALQIFEDNGKAFGRSENDYELQYAIKYMNSGKLK